MNSTAGLPSKCNQLLKISQIKRLLVRVVAQRTFRKKKAKEKKLIQTTDGSKNLSAFPAQTPINIFIRSLRQHDTKQEHARLTSTSEHRGGVQ